MQTKAKPVLYLAGAMERAPVGYGEAWREEVDQYATQLGFDVLNPYKQEAIALREFGYAHPSEWAHLRHGSDEEKEIHKKIVSKLIHWDLDLIERSTSAIACRWDSYTQAGAGTTAELTLSFRLKLPVITWVSCEMAKVPAWLIPCFGKIVFSMEDLKNEIFKLNLH